MKKSLRRALVIVLAIAMLLTVLLPAVSIFVQASTVTQDDIDNLKDELSDISDRKDEIQDKLDEIRDDMEQAQEAVELVNEQVLLTEQQIDNTQALINETQGKIDESQAKLDQYDADIAAKEAEIADLEEQEAAQYDEFYAQTRWMEETGPISYLSILFEAKSFDELLDYVTLVSDIMEYSNQIIKQLNVTQDALAKARDQVQALRDGQAAVQADLEAQRAEQEEQKAQLESQKAQLERDRADAQALLDQIAASESSYAQQARELAAAEAELKSEIKDAEQKYADQLAALGTQGNVNSGDWYWPVPGNYGLSSLFGGRYHPITGLWQSHSGTDILVAGGTPIHAAKDGVVTYVQAWNGWSISGSQSYGNMCMISHGDGYVTLYAHQKTYPLVSVGQYVTKGQVIGYVGTTGASTGYHLHYELRINDTRSSVLQLYPDLTFTYSGYSWKGNNVPF